jgi:hypothetical protein
MRAFLIVVVAFSGIALLHIVATSGASVRPEESITSPNSQASASKPSEAYERP